MKNDGNNANYYKIPKDARDLIDVIEQDEMNFSQGNILKSAWCLKKGRHDGTNYVRELKKIIYFAKRELERVGITVNLNYPEKTEKTENNLSEKDIRDGVSAFSEYVINECILKD